MKVTDARRITDFRFLNVIRARFEHRGEEGEWLYVSRDLPKAPGMPDAVAIIPILGRKIVLIRQYRVPLGDYVIEFPAGLVDSGGSVLDTARKELKEETGLVIEKVLHVGPIVYNSPGLADESCCCVFAEVSGEPTTSGNEAAEDIEILVLDDSGLAELLSRGDVKMDAKCWLILHLRAALARGSPP